MLQLPALKNVDAILEYANCKKSQGNVDSKEYAVSEVVGGIKEYFNVVLRTSLGFNLQDHKKTRKHEKKKIKIGLTNKV